MNSEAPIHVIEGGAGPVEAAAITAAIAQVLAEEAAAAAVPVRPPSQSRWVTSWRPQAPGRPSSSSVFDGTPGPPRNYGDTPDPE